MKIIEMKALRGPNYYSRHPVIHMKLDLQELEERPTDTVPEFKDLIAQVLPSLYEHKCSPGYIGGFFERLVTGTWAGHVVEHVALELQCQAGHDVRFGKTYDTSEYGIYNLVFRYVDEKTGLRAGQMAVDIVENLFEGIITDAAPLIEELKKIAETDQLGPSTQSIVSEAASRGIPFYRLNEGSYVQLGQGKYQRKIQATIADSTSAIGVEIADDKERTKQILSSIGIPVSKGRSVESLEEAYDVAQEIGYPVVVKPLIGNHGRGITVNVENSDHLRIAYEMASKVYRTCLIEKYIQGFDFRVLVIDGKFVAAALREPAFVIGNGKGTIRELIEEINRDPERGEGHDKNLTRITMDHSTMHVLSLQQLTLDSVLPQNKKIYIKSTANLSTGGTALDVTDKVHPINKLMAERAARAIGLNIMGIDILAESLQVPLEQGTSGVVEVNAAPGFRMHLSPVQGKSRNIAAHVVDMLFPPGTPHSVPICAVTGTNGKTTTTRLISHMLEVSGCIVGMTSTDSVTIDNIPIIKGDYSGPEGAKAVMRDATVDHAVLEVARGGILRRGLGYKEADVGVLLNVTSDHLGEGGIDTLEDLARLKSTVTESVKPDGYSVFNADDPLVLSCVGRTKARPILFSHDPGHPALCKNLAKGNFNITVKDGSIILQKSEGDVVIAGVNEIPITFNGKAGFNVANVMAAAGAGFGLGLDEKQIRAGLVSFTASIDQSPGRLNIIDMGSFKVIVDYGHNVEAVHAIGGFIQGFMPGRKIRMAAGVGNRRTEDIYAYGEALAAYYDQVVLYDSSPRQRKPGETADIVREGLLKGGLQPNMVTSFLLERDATRAALELARPGDLVVLQADNITQVIKDVLDFRAKLAVVPVIQAAEGSA